MSQTLQDFFADYLRNSEIRNAPLSYGDWLSEKGTDAVGDYEKRWREIESDFHRSLPNLGAVAEKLGITGLTDSGYSEYLGAKAYAVRDALRSGAAKDYRADLKKNANGYADYLDGYRSGQRKLAATVVNDLTAAGVTDRETAYRYAVSAGLSADVAGAVADEILRVYGEKVKAENEPDPIPETPQTQIPDENRIREIIRQMFEEELERLSAEREENRKKQEEAEKAADAEAEKKAAEEAAKKAAEEAAAQAEREKAAREEASVSPRKKKVNNSDYY